VLIPLREFAALEGKSPDYVRQSMAPHRVYTDARERNGKPIPHYPADKLSAPAQAKLARQQERLRGPRDKAVKTRLEIVAGAECAAPQLTLTPPAGTGAALSVDDRSTAEKRYRVIEPLIEPAKFPSLWREMETVERVVQFLAGQVWDDGKRYSVRSIFRFRGAFLAPSQDGGVMGMQGLAPKTREDKGVSRVVNDVTLHYLARLALPKREDYKHAKSQAEADTWGKLSATEIHRQIEAERKHRARNPHLFPPEMQLSRMSPRTCQMWVDKIATPLKTMAQDGPRKFSVTHQMISWRKRPAPLHWLVMDHRMCDLVCRVRTMVKGRPSWELQRPWMTACVDMGTWKCLGWVMVAQPSSDSIASVMKSVMLNHGLALDDDGTVKTHWYWDWGKDFVCVRFEGPHVRSWKLRGADLPIAWRGVCSTLGTKVTHSIPSAGEQIHAQSKIIEAWFSAGPARFDATLPYYCGNRPDHRPERLTRLLAQHEEWMETGVGQPPFPSMSELAFLYGDFIARMNDSPHAAADPRTWDRRDTPEGQRFESPNERWDRLIQQVKRRAVSPEVIHFTFAKRKELRVKHTEVTTSFAGRQMRYRLMFDPIRLSAINTRKCQLAYDPLDLGIVAIYYESEFLGLAQNPELRGMGEPEFVQDERDRRAYHRDVNNFIETLHAGQPPIAGPIESALRRAAVEPRRLEQMVETFVPPAIAEEAEARAELARFRFADVPEIDRDRVQVITESSPDASSSVDEDDGALNW
jgi:hypothetical protein